MKYFLILLTALMCFSCSNQIDDSIESSRQTYEVTFTTNLPVKVTSSKRNAPRKTSVVNNVTVDNFYVFEDSKQIYHTDNFNGTVSLNLSRGKHNLVFIASNATDSINGTKFLTSKLQATYAYKETYEVTTNTNISVELKRINYEIHIIPTDSIAENTSHLEVGFSKLYNAFNTSSLEGIARTYTTNKITYYDCTFHKDYTQLGDSVVICGYTNQDEQETVDLTICLTSKNGTTYTQLTSPLSIPSVPIQRNCITRITGNLVNGTAGGNITINTEYTDVFNKEF